MGDNPFASYTVLSRVFEMAVAGTTVDELLSYCAASGVQGRPVLRTLRRCEYKGKVWRVDELHGRFRIIYPLPAGDSNG